MPRHKKNNQTKTTAAPVMTQAANEVPEVAKEPVKKTEKQSQNALIETIQKSDLAAVEMLIASPTFFKQSYKDKEGNTPLHHVAKIEDEKVRNKIAEALIYAGMDITLRNDNGVKPDHYKEFKSIKDKSQKRFLGTFANWVLIKPRGQEKKLAAVLILQLLIAVFVPQLALTYGAVWMMQLLVGAIIQAIDKMKLQNYQAQQTEADFVRAIVDNQLNTVKLVKYIEQGVNIHLLAHLKSSALKGAVIANNLEQVNFLLPYSSKKDILYAFMESAHQKDYDAIFERLLSQAKKADLSYVLYVVIRTEQSKRVQSLIEKGVKVSKFDRWAAIGTKNPAIIKLIDDALNKANSAPTKEMPKAQSIGKAPVTPLFAAKQKEAAKATAKSKAKATKPEAKATVDPKRTLRSHTNKK